MTVRSGLACCAAALLVTTLVWASPALAEPSYVGTDERFTPSVGITLHRTDMRRWAAKGDVVRAYCFFHAANVAQVDGRWYAINGIALSGMRRHWIEDGEQHDNLVDEHKAPVALRAFLYEVNDKMNDACP